MHEGSRLLFLHFVGASCAKAVCVLSVLCFNREAISFLANQGHLYTTLDDSHFKTTGE
jgi:hypothetical protein